MDGDQGEESATSEEDGWADHPATWNSSVTERLKRDSKATAADKAFMIPGDRELG